MLSPGSFQHCSLLFNDWNTFFYYYFFLPVPKGQKIYNPLGAGGAALFPFTVAPAPIANGTCRVTNIVSSSYTFLFLEPSDNIRLFSSALQTGFLDCPDSRSVFTCFSFGGTPVGIWFRDRAPSLSKHLCFLCLALLQRAYRRKLAALSLKKLNIIKNKPQGNSPYIWDFFSISHAILEICEAFSAAVENWESGERKNSFVLLLSLVMYHRALH